MIRLATILVALASSFPTLANGLSGRASVIDGDTIDIHGQRIRLIGIDAPEAAQRCFMPDGTKWRCGQKAAFALQDFIGNEIVRCEVTGESYDRFVAQCWLQTTDLSSWLANQGWAVVDPRYGDRYRLSESKARKAGRNLWQGGFIEPWVWREHR